MEMGILVLFREVVVDINQHVTGTIPLAPERERTCGERESGAWKGGRADTWSQNKTRTQAPGQLGAE